jgi:hypothetical protein
LPARNLNERRCGGVWTSEGAECASKENHDHEKDELAFALLTVILMNYEGVHAQEPSPKLAPVITAPDLSKRGIEKTLQQVQTTKVQPNAQEASPLQVVAEFLQLVPIR